MLTKERQASAIHEQIQALIAQARERSRRRRHRVVVFVAGFVVTAVLAAAVTGWISGGLVTSGPRHHGAIHLGRSARVSGFISACDPAEMSAGSPLPPSQGGVVEVLRRHVRSGPVIAGAREFVLPAGPAVAIERIGAGQRFSFVLRPGRYTLLARFAAGGHIRLAYHRGGRIVPAPYRQSGPVVQFSNVTIKSGTNLVEDIPSNCL